MKNLNFSKEYINNDEEIEILQNESKKNMNSSDSSDKKRFSFNFIYFFFNYIIFNRCRFYSYVFKDIFQ